MDENIFFLLPKTYSVLLRSTKTDLFSVKTGSLILPARVMESGNTLKRKSSNFFRNFT